MVKLLRVITSDCYQYATVTWTLLSNLKVSSLKSYSQPEKRWMCRIISQRGSFTAVWKLMLWCKGSIKWTAVLTNVSFWDTVVGTMTLFTKENSKHMTVYNHLSMDSNSIMTFSCFVGLEHFTSALNGPRKRFSLRFLWNAQLWMCWKGKETF